MEQTFDVKYRVIIKAGYNEVWFEFEDPIKACDFAKVALGNMVDCPDTKRRPFIRMEIIDVDAPADAEDEDE